MLKRSLGAVSALAVICSVSFANLDRAAHQVELDADKFHDAAHHGMDVAYTHYGRYNRNHPVYKDYVHLDKDATEFYGHARSFHAQFHTYTTVPRQRKAMKQMQGWFDHMGETYVDHKHSWVHDWQVNHAWDSLNNSYQSLETQVFSWRQRGFGGGWNPHDPHHGGGYHGGGHWNGNGGGWHYSPDGR